MLKLRDGTQLHCVDYFPARPAHSGIVFMHGLGEHCGRYAHVAAFFFVNGGSLCGPMLIAATVNHRVNAVISPTKTAFSTMLNKLCTTGKQAAQRP